MREGDIQLGEKLGPESGALCFVKVGRFAYIAGRRRPSPDETQASFAGAVLRRRNSS